MAISPLHRPPSDIPVPHADPHGGRLAAEIDRWYAASGAEGATVVLAEIEPGTRSRAAKPGRRATARTRRALEGLTTNGVAVWNVGDARLGCLVRTPGGTGSGAALAHELERATRRRLTGRTGRVTYADLDPAVVRSGEQVVEVLGIALSWASDTSASPVAIPVR